MDTRITITVTDDGESLEVIATGNAPRLSDDGLVFPGTAILRMARQVASMYEKALPGDPRWHHVRIADETEVTA